MEEAIQALRIKTTGPSQAVRHLSGGNQQKAVLGRCAITEPRVLLLDEPTAGVDPKARRDFWDQIHRIAGEGTTISVALRNAIMVIGGTAYLLYLAPLLTAALVGVVVVVIPLMALFGRRVRAVSRESQDRIADLGAYVFARDYLQIAAIGMVLMFVYCGSDWLPEDDVAHFIVAAAERVELELPETGVCSVAGAASGGFQGELSRDDLGFRLDGLMVQQEDTSSARLRSGCDSQ